MKTLVPPDEGAWLEVSAWEYWKIGLQAVVLSAAASALLCCIAFMA
jgi:hypothetical protein